MRMMLLLVTFGIMVIITGSVKGEETKHLNGSICEDEACTELVKKIKLQMGSSEPCDDFYNYVCGNWSGYHEPKPVDLKKKAVQDLKELLEKATPSLTAPSNATDKLIRAYMSCARKGEDLEALRQSVRKVLDQYFLGQWPVTQMDQNISNLSYVEILKRSGPRSLFPYSAEVKDGAPIIVMSPPTNFEVYDQDDYEYHEYTDDTDTERENNNEGTTMSLKDFAQKSEKSYKTFITQTIKLVSNGSVTENQTNEIADNIISFEKNLSKLAFGANKSTENMTITQLSQKISDKFLMTEVLQKDLTVVGIPIENNTNVIVKDVDYYKGVGTLLETMKNTNILANYIMWTYVKRMAEAEGTLLHKIYLEYKRNTSISEYNKNKSTEDKELRCLYQLLQSDVMYTVGASYYIKAKFNSTSKSEVTKIFEFISSEFHTFIKNNTWMSENIKKAALERLKNMTVVIGYPEWMMEDDTIDFMYKYASNVSENASFVEHYHQLKENDHFQKLLVLNYCYKNKTNEDVVLKSNAYYLDRLELLAYPAASLVTHYRPQPIPRALNFGTIGVILGKLLTASIDRFHAKYKTNNQFPGDSWDNDTKTNFCKYSECLNNTKQCWDTTDVHNSSYQYFLGYISIRLAHEALKKSKNNYTGASLLPDKKFDSEDKIFFISYGSLYCPHSIHNSTKKVEARYYIEEEDLPKSLNEVVSKYKEFNSTFNCSGDLTDTCNLIPPQWKRDVITC